MKKLIPFILILLFIFPAESHAQKTVTVSSSLMTCSEFPEMKAKVFLRGKFFSLKKIRITSIRYKLGPYSQSSDKNNIFIGTEKSKTHYYSSPDVIKRNGLKGNYLNHSIKKKVFISFMKPVFITVSFDRLGSDPECSGSTIFNFASFKKR